MSKKATDGKLVIDPELSSLVAPLSDDEQMRLEATILAHGCRDPLVVWAGKDILLDGHHRKRICERHGLDYHTVEVELADRDAAADWIDANQLARRNLAPDVASILRGRLYNRAKKRHGGDRRSSAQSEHLKTAEAIADKAGVSPATVRRDAKKAEFVEALPESDRKAIMAGKVKVTEVRRQQRKAKVVEKAKMPSGKFRVIYADPPWSYNDKCSEGAVQAGGAETRYPSMTISELCRLPVRGQVEDDAVLFLWVTSPLLAECWPVITAWGFKYKASFVWYKVKHNMGHYNSVRHEFLLVCTRGSCLPDNKKLYDSVQSIERGKHSEKPAEFRTIIETLYPHGRKLEMFARTKAKGWESHGNELP